jgi:hypothetical protein
VLRIFSLGLLLLLFFPIEFCMYVPSREEIAVSLFQVHYESILYMEKIHMQGWRRKGGKKEEEGAPAGSQAVSPVDKFSIGPL